MRDAGLASSGLLLLASLALVAPSTGERAASRLRHIAAGSGQATPARRQAGRWRSSGPGLASALAGAAAGLLLGWPGGCAAGPAIFALSRAVLRRLADRARRPVPVRVSAFATELVAACLDAGATPAAALQAAGAHVADPLGSALTGAADALSGGDTAQEALPEDGALSPLAAVFRRSSQTGSAMSDQLIGVAAQLRADEQFDRLAKAQRVGVLSALPLGLCLLPAFLLLAVVPAVLGLGAGLLP